MDVSVFHFHETRAGVFSECSLNFKDMYDVQKNASICSVCEIFLRTRTAVGLTGLISVLCLSSLMWRFLKFQHIYHAVFLTGRYYVVNVFFIKAYSY